MTFGTAEPIALVLQNTIERINIAVTDSAGVALDATALSLQVFDIGGTLILKDDFFNGYGNPATPPTHIVKPAGVGQYYFPYGDTSFDTKNSTAVAGDFLFVWQVTGQAGTQPVNVVQVIKVVTARTMSWVPYLRLIIDKSSKIVDDDPADPVYLGYTDQMLIQFIENGLTLINAFQPYPVWDGIDAFPSIHRQVLLDAALFVGLTSQELFAVDTDINYSDQGNTFTIQHQPMLASILNSTWQRLSTIVPLMKRQYVQSGNIHSQIGPSFRFAQLLNAAPFGSSFRNMFVAGM